MRKTGAEEVELIACIAIMQRCLPLRRQQAGTLLLWKHRVSGAKTPTHRTASNELAISRLKPVSLVVVH